MSNFQPPPTYASPVLVDEKTGKSQFNPIWLKWFVDLVSVLGPTGAGSVSEVSIVTANGVSGSVADPTTTPAITLALGAITPASVAAIGTVTGSNLSGTNTGDQTNITGNAGTATALQNARTIGGVSFNGTANITVASATGGFTVTGGALTGLGGASFITTSTALTDGAAAALGTLTNAPAAGDPTKWIGINDNGTLRYIPAW